MATRKEIIDKHAAKYRKASKKGKGEILNFVCFATGLSRDRAARVLRGKERRPRPSGKRGRKRIYGHDVFLALKKLWITLDFACGKRLHEGLADMLDALIRYQEVDFNEEIIFKLRRMSASTMDRLLKKERESLRLKGICTTKPGTLLKHNIPIRLGQEWNDDIPGFVEIDLVAHCGSSAAGEYINTLNVTDICTGWTEPIAVLNKAQRHVFAGLLAIEQRQPFKYLGIDSDNGSEFINHELKRYCDANHICFTRSRPYTKNDNCHIEQKNWSLVRRHIGYGRYEGENALALLNEYYSLLRLLVNFFYPSTKLLEKQRQGARVYKRYEKPLSPYKRVLKNPYISEKVKEELVQTFLTINPAKVISNMARIQNSLEAYWIPD